MLIEFFSKELFDKSFLHKKGIAVQNRICEDKLLTFLLNVVVFNVL